MTATMKPALIKLLTRKWVTPLIALNEVNCLSLSQRCGELRRTGVNVASRWVETATGKRVKAYKIVTTSGRGG